jgi:hypothetical protein
MRIYISWIITLLLGAVILSPAEIAAQASSQISDKVSASSGSGLDSGLLPHSETPEAIAIRTNVGIQVDGQLDEAIWLQASPITEFTQDDPNEGQPITEPTEVRFLYDDDAIYVGAWFYDSEPVTTRLARRDAFVSDSDWFVILFDSYHDHQTAYRFATNPSGMKRDEIQSGRGFGRGGGFGGGDRSWDPIWEVATSVTNEGWFAEIRIPFSQLRFSPAEDQTWGMQIERAINRRQERAVFSFTPKLDRGGVARYGHLSGIRGVGGGKKMEILPYVGVSAEYVQQTPSDVVAFENPFRSGSDYFSRTGVDLKYRVGSNLTLDATVNPDFGQVEVDPAVINLTAFETRLQERRPFFVEGAEIFEFGRGGPTGSTGRAPEIIYSRRIGRRPQGSVSSDAVYSDKPVATTIAGAAKITGKIGNGWSLGLLEAVTGSETAPYIDELGANGSSITEPSANYFLGRIRKDMRAGQTRIGALASAVNRDITDPDLAEDLRTAAYTTGLDFQHEWANRGWRLNGAFASSYIQGSEDAMIGTQRSSARHFHRPDADHLSVDSTATSMSGYYAMMDLTKQSGYVQMKVAMAALSPGYEVNDMGFQTETDRFIIDTDLSYQQPRPGRHFRNWRMWGSPDAKWNSNGDLIFANFNSNLRFQLLNYWGGSMRVAYDFATDDDRLTRGGPMARRPSEWGGNISINSDSRKALSLRSRYNWETKEDGSWSHSANIDFTYKSGEKVELRLGPDFRRSFSASQYVTSIGDELATATYGRRYVFAPIDQTTVSLETRLNITVSPTLTFELFAQPLLSRGNYGGLKEFSQPGTRDFRTYGVDVGTLGRGTDGYYVVDPDGAGAAESFSLSDRDFNFQSLLGNAVLRWEWSPGSTFFLVWQQSRSQRILGSDYDQESYDGVGAFDLGNDAGELFGVTPDNIFLVKVNYWLNM